MTPATKSIILACNLAAGDTVLLTAAVRDLFRCYPVCFQIRLLTPFPEIYAHNPFLALNSIFGSKAKTVECLYPLIDRSNTTPHHVIHGFINFLNKQLNLSIEPTEFKGDIHLSNDEKSWDSQVQELAGEDMPFWIVVAGGKYDVTIKWWEARRYQQVVDHYRGRIQFVQVGAKEHHHPKLDGVSICAGRRTCGN